MESHAVGTGILSVKQWATIGSAVKAAPLAAGSAIHARLNFFSPSNSVASDPRIA